MNQTALGFLFVVLGLFFFFKLFKGDLRAVSSGSLAKGKFGRNSVISDRDLTDLLLRMVVVKDSQLSWMV